MSFAPRSRSRERNAFQSGVAVQPQVPVQREPLHRYGSGVVVPGVSMKGGHVFEGIVVDGRAVTTRLNSGEKPTNLLRSTSPLALTRPEVTRKDRTYRLKGSLPQTVNTVSQSRSRTSSPTSTTGGGSGAIIPNRTFLEISSKNMNTFTNKLSSSDNVSVGSYHSINSNNRPSSASSVSSRSYSSSTRGKNPLRKSESFSIIENIQQLNNFETKSLASRRSTSPSLLRSLSQSSRPADSPSIHSIQLTQSAYRKVRKSANQDNLLDFISFHKETTAAENMGLIMDSISPEGKQYITNLLNSHTSPGVKSLSEYKNTSPVTGLGSTIQSPSTEAELKRIKKLLQLSKMCKDEIDREMVYFTSHDQNNLFFPMENEKSSIVVAARNELYDIIQHSFIPILNSNLSKLRETENKVLNENKIEMNELHSVIDNKEEELIKIVEANNKLKRKIAKLVAKYDILSNNSDNEFTSTLVEMFGPAFSQTIMEQLRNPNLFTQELIGFTGRDTPSVGFPDLQDLGPTIDDDDDDDNHFEVFGLHEQNHEMDYREVTPPPPPPKDRFTVNYDVIQQLAEISPQITTKRVAPDPTPPRKYPASPFLQQHSPNAIVQSVLQGYKSPYTNKAYTKHLHNVSLSTISSGTGNIGTSPTFGINKNNSSTPVNGMIDLTLSESTTPANIKNSSMMPHSAGSNTIVNHHVNSQQLYRRSMSPTTMLAHVNSTVSTSTVTPASKRPISPAYNSRQEIITTPEQQQVIYAKVDYRQLHGMESFSAGKEANKPQSPKMFIRSPPKVPVPTFSTSQSNKERNSFGKSMMEVMLNSTY